MTTREKARIYNGFTLIEIMVVVGIIVILAAIGMHMAMGVKSNSNERTTKTQLTALDSAMAVFLKNNAEPNNANWVAALLSYPDSKTVIAKQKLSGSGASQSVLDGYNNPIVYIPSNTVPAAIPTWSKKPNGIFWSYGPDGQPGGTDDIFSDGTSAQ